MTMKQTLHTYAPATSRGARTYPGLWGSVAAFIFTLLLPLAAAARADDQTADSAFAGMMQHYEAVRLALLADGMSGVSEHGHEIHGIVERLGVDWTPERAGVGPDKADEARALLSDLSAAAVELAETRDLDGAREALYSLSKPLVRYRMLATGDLPAVAYCPMAKKSWLQPGEEIGNPYYGQEMPGCGEIVTPGGRQMGNGR